MIMVTPRECSDGTTSVHETNLEGSKLSLYTYLHTHMHISQELFSRREAFVCFRIVGLTQACMFVQGNYEDDQQRW